MYWKTRRLSVVRKFIKNGVGSRANRSCVLLVFLRLYYKKRKALKLYVIQGDTKKRELLKNPTKIEEIKEKKLLTEIETLQLAF